MTEPYAATAIILAGGRSTRMGQNKSLLGFRGVPLIQYIVHRLRPHFEQVVISANEPEQFAFLDLEITPDRQPGEGPLLGIISALHASRHEINFVCACDIPEIPLELVHVLVEQAEHYDCVTPVCGDRYEPLFAAYRKSALPVLEAAVDEGIRSVRACLERCRRLEVPIEEGLLLNINTFEEYRELLRSELEGTT